MKKYLRIVSFLLMAAMVLSLSAFAAEEDPQVNIVMSTSKNQTETAGIMLDYFCDYVEEKSGGSITFSRNYGGVIASTGEEFDYVSGGAIDLTCLQASSFGSQIPLFQFPSSPNGSSENAVAYGEYLLYENEETSALIAQEAEENNIKYLGFLAGGASVIVSTFEVDELSDFFSVKFGTGVDIPAYEAIGFNCVTMMPPDGYESLERGVVDCTVMSFVPTVQMKWYEVAPYYYYVGTYAIGNPITLNLDVWNSLSENQQAILTEAGLATTAYSLEYINGVEADCVKEIEDAGGSVNNLSDEDLAYYFGIKYSAMVQDAYNRAKEMGCEDDMAVILQAAADFLDVDVSDVLG